MQAGIYLIAIIIVLVFLYLLYVLIHPEKF